MTLFLTITAAALIILVLIQVRDGGLNVVASSTLQAPTVRRGAVLTLHVLTIIVSCVFVGGCIAAFLI